jgi:hypothetical protein
MPTKSGLAKSQLFVPSLETARRIDDQDNALAVSAAVYRVAAIVTLRARR